ncbi:MAG: O-antigen ligase family protein [Pseudomonadota bacterium]|nr:O-antigen ligase family protein [Pseudomonadota bacterium]
MALALLHAVLFLTILISPLVFIEPSPYDGAVVLLGFTCILARVPFARGLLPLFFLLTLWKVSGMVSLMPVVEQSKTVRYTFISMFMAFTAIIYACLFAKDSLRRLAIMRRAYIIAAVIASMTGIIGYFNLVPGAAKVFLEYGRISATFKDPNVFGPFLILPLLLLIWSLLVQRLRLTHVIALCVLLLGLFLSFSRAAWVGFGLSTVVMIVLTFLTAPDRRTRARIILLTVVATAALAGLFAFAISFDVIGDMFRDRAKIAQDYDVSSGGRFALQELAIGELLAYPLGLGPFEFARLHGLQQHNVYLQAFLVYGWLGGFAYVTMVLMTILLGLRAAFVSTPWQPYVITALAAFVGAFVVGLVIDTDHWRHFFLLLGLIWGLAAATSVYRQQAPAYAAGHVRLAAQA